MDPQNNQGQQNGSPMNSQNNNTIMAVLAYIGILVVVPLITSKDNAFVKFHIKQGLVLLVIEIASMIIASMMWQLFMITWLINLATIVLSIIGIINVTQGLQKELPVVGGFAKSFTF